MEKTKWTKATVEVVVSEGDFGWKVETKAEYLGDDGRTCDSYRMGYGTDLKDTTMSTVSRCIDDVMRSAYRDEDALWKRYVSGVRAHK